MVHLTGGNTYKQVGPANQVGGQPAFRGIATLINWDWLKIDPAVRIKENSIRIKQRFKPTPTEIKPDPVAIVAYGPSLHATWRQVAYFKTIFTCSGAHRFLLERGLRPTYHVDSDPRQHKVGMLGTPQPDTIYLPASIVNPDYFGLLSEAGCEQVQLWHLFFMEPAILAATPNGEPMLTGGDTVGPRTMKIARLMGYTNLHFFGFDASRGGAQTHAETHPNPRNDDWFSVGSFTTCDDWLTHADMMLADLDRMPEISYQFHGKGLFQTKAASHIPSIRSPLPLIMVKNTQ